MVEETNFKTEREFRSYLDNLQQEFSVFLSSRVSKRTVRKHSAIIGLFIDFICFDCQVRSIIAVTRGMANSYFRKWYNSKIGDVTESELKTAIKKFFIFLDTEKQITNYQVLDSFKRK